PAAAPIFVSTTGPERVGEPRLRARLSHRRRAARLRSKPDARLRRTRAEARPGGGIHAPGSGGRAARVAPLHVDVSRHARTVAGPRRDHIAKPRRERSLALAAEAAARRHGPG